MANEKEVEFVDEEELDKAMEEAKDAPGMTTVKLNKPVAYDGETYEELTFDFDSLTGEDAINIEEELAAEGKPVVIVAAFRSDYLIRMAARACTKPIGHDIFKKMSLRDYNRVTGAAKSFLLAVG